MNFVPATPKQDAMRDFIAVWISNHGSAPTLQAIADAFKLRSLATVHKHLEALKEKGYIRRVHGRHRSIELVWQTDCCPTCGRPRE